VMGLKRPLVWVFLTTGTYRIATNAFMLETPSDILGHPNETVFAWMWVLLFQTHPRRFKQN
jgi:hypothetical protein